MEERIAELEGKNYYLDLSVQVLKAELCLTQKALEEAKAKAT